MTHTVSAAALSVYAIAVAAFFTAMQVGVFEPLSRRRAGRSAQHAEFRRPFS